MAGKLIEAASLESGSRFKYEGVWFTARAVRKTLKMRVSLGGATLFLDPEEVVVVEDISDEPDRLNLA